MKKVMMMALMMCFVFTSCKKDVGGCYDPNATNYNPNADYSDESLCKYDCSCGTISNDGIDNGCYWLEIRNVCSGNKKTFCFDQDIWMSNYVGDYFCVTNQPSW
jgi:hypothetical protein